MHVYSFKKNKSQLDLENDTFEQLKPGLSSYQDDPQKAAESLEPLMRIALDTVPKHLQVSISNSVESPRAPCNQGLSHSPRAQSEEPNPCRAPALCSPQIGAANHELVQLDRTGHEISLFMQSETKIKLGATAGLRLLPEGKADLILDAVKAYFAQSPFKLDPKFGVTILDGEHQLEHQGTF